MTFMENDKVTVNREDVFKVIEELCDKTRKEFAGDSQSSYIQRLLNVCQEIGESSPLILSSLIRVVDMAPKFDYDENIPGNGFRSMICICDTAALHIVSVLRTCLEHKNNTLFRVSYFTKELENYMAVFRFWILSTQQLIGSIDYDNNNSLFPPIDVDNYTNYISVFKAVEGFDASCFYSRPLGLQFCPSISKMFKIVCTFFASYSKACEKGNGAIDTIINSAKYIISPEERASKIVDIIREADIEFCKGFWNLPELATIPKWLGITVAVCELREIEVKHNLVLETNEHGKTIIPKPSTIKNIGTIKYRYISSVYRSSKVKCKKDDKYPLSPYLIFHCHGGGYLATSSKSHECYLRSWAKQTNCPVVSIDYSLAPENPYPKPTEEVLYAYGYIIRNPHKFGWTGEKIVFIGDSAGGNLITSVTIRLVTLNIKKMPDAVIPIYTPFLFQYLPSPSRMLSFMDPLLHVGMLLRCLTAYTMGDVPINKVPLLTKLENIKDSIEKINTLENYVEEFKNSQFRGYFNFDNNSQTLISFLETTINCSLLDDTTIPSDGSNTMENDLEDSPFNVTQNVEIGSDPKCIVLSSDNCDKSLIEYFNSRFPIKKNQDSWDIDDNDDVFMEVSTKPQLDTSTLKVPRNDTKKRSLSQTLVRTASLAASYAMDNLNDWLDSDKKPIGHNDKKKLRNSLSMSAQEAAIEQQKMADLKKTALDELLSIQIPRNPEISPMYADDETLQKLPPFYFIGCHLDPLLDDTISFARKLKKAGKLEGL
uniref:Hormone-sensitive lipase n=1 Tax=Parastrongyloides trichosuri TaxID=131310 RepID=A0A0N4ZFU3_PARTI